MKLVVSICLFFLIACTHPPCSELSYNNKNAMNIVFLPDGFTPEHQRELANYTMTTIQQKEPFASKPYFNFYLIDNQNTSICQSYKPDKIIGAYSAVPPLKCDVDAVKQLVNSCGIERGKIIFLSEKNVESQSSISYADSGVMFLNMQNEPPEIIQHEFAHLFGLVDEKAKLVSFDTGPGRQTAPNCVDTLEDAQKFWGRLYPDGHQFIQGCAGTNWRYKPEANTIMDNPDPKLGYGTFNTWYLGKAMDCCYAPNRTKNFCDDFFALYPQWTACRS